MEKKRIVVKVGTSTLCHSGKGLNFRNIDMLSRTLADMKNSGHEVILVSSGAIGAGCGKLNLPNRPTDLRVLQAVAAVGQCELMHVYDKLFGEYGVAVGQILLTRDDVEKPNVKQNLLGTFESLLQLGVIPVVNENDSVCLEEIESEHKVFGGNDMLSAVVAVLVGADLLVLLTDFDGLYDSDPRKNPAAKRIDIVDDIDSVKAYAGGAGSDFGTGGMAVKLDAAKLTTENGIDMIIADGATPQSLYKIMDGGIDGAVGTVGTYFRRKSSGV
jgi:glutamate 5-kinase